MKWQDFYMVRRYEDIMQKDPPHRRPAFILCYADGFPVPDAPFLGWETRSGAEIEAERRFRKTEAELEELLLGKRG